MGTGTIQSGFPSLLLSDELVSLAGSVGQEAPWQQQGQGTTLRLEALGLDKMPAPNRVSSQQSTEQPHRASDSPCPLPSTGLIFVTSEASCSTEKRKV